MNLGRRSAALVGLAAGALLAAATVTGQVAAHAALISTDPADGEVVDAAPQQVVLTFNEPVSLAGGSVRVLNDDATQVSADPVQSGVTITAPLPEGLADGTYTVAYEVVSADSHRIAGASVFHVGAATSAGLDANARGGGGDVGWGVRAGAVALSALAYAAALIATGAWWFSRSAERVPAGSVDESRTRLRLDSVVVRSAVLGAVAIVAAVPFRIAVVGGGLDALRDNDLLAAELRGPIGVAAAVTALGLLAFAVAAERRGPMWLVTPLAIVALVGFSLEGHTRAASWRAVMIGSDVVHLGAAAVWIGGLFGLTVAFRSDIDPVRLARLVRQFSATALITVAVVAVTGVTMAWIILPTVGELTSTGYGLALVVKVALVVVVVVLGAYNRRWLVPAVDRDHRGPGGAHGRLARIVLAELAILLVVVAVTAVLVTRSPVGSSSAAPPPTTVVPDELALEMSGGAGTVEVTVTPGAIGTNDIAIVLRDAEDRIVNPIDAPVVELSQPALDIGPLRPDVVPVDIGRYEAAADLGFAGEWDLVVRVRLSDFVSATASGTVHIE